MWKKAVAVILAAATLFCLTACQKKGVKTYRIGIAIYQYDDNFMTLVRKEMLAYFDSLETDTVKYKVSMVDGKNDMAEQANQVDSFIAQGMDVIILNLILPSSADAMVKKVTDAGIPLVLINREPLGYDENGEKIEEGYPGILQNENVCYVGADARQSGIIQGEMVNALPDHADLNGDGKISYLMIMGEPDHIDAQYRTEYSVSTITDAGYEVECLDAQYGNWSQATGQEIAANAIAQFGDELELVLCNNDSMALGALAAIHAAGRTVGKDVYLYGVDALEEAMACVKNGTMSGTVLNDHIGQAHTMVDVAIKMLHGEKTENYYWVDYRKVDQSYFEGSGDEA